MSTQKRQKSTETRYIDKEASEMDKQMDQPWLTPHKGNSKLLIYITEEEEVVTTSH